MPDPVAIFAGENVERLRSRLAVIEAKQADAGPRFAPDPPRPKDPPAWRTRLTAALRYPDARMAHIDDDLRGHLDGWWAALGADQPAFDDPEPGNLFLLGTPGTGKTVAACAVADMAAREVSVAFARVSDVLADERPDGTRQLRHQLAEVDLVVLDDLLAVSLTEWAEETLGDILDDVVHPPGGRTGATLVVTSNVYPDQLAARLGPRIWSRLGGPSAWIVPVLGDDRRGEKLARLEDDPEPPRGPCQLGCDRGWIHATPEAVEQAAGPSASPERIAAHTNTVRPCPNCRTGARTS